MDVESLDYPSGMAPPSSAAARDLEGSSSCLPHCCQSHQFTKATKGISLAATCPASPLSRNATPGEVTWMHETLDLWVMVSAMPDEKGQAGACPKCPRPAVAASFRVHLSCPHPFPTSLSSKVCLVRPQCPTSIHSLLSPFAAILTVTPVTGPVLEEMLQLPRTAGNCAGH